jgi:DnaK suppressor protein
MDKADQSFFRGLLFNRLKDLNLKAEEASVSLIDTDNNFPDPTDRATAETERDFMLRIRERERKLIIKIQEALQRIDEGDFGECEECGDDIGTERLKARPEATLCIGCKRKQESAERVRGL